MKFSFRFLFGLMILPLLLGAVSSVQAGFIPVSFSDKVGVGCQSGSQSTFGDYKSCGTDAYFYFILVNESDDDVKITLPTRVYVNHSYLPIDPEGWYYKPILNEWTWEQYADAKSGEALPVDTYGVFMLPAHTVYSIMGHMTKLPYTFTLLRDVVSVTDSTGHFEFQLEVIFNTEAEQLFGSFISEGNLCGGVEPVAFAAGQNIRAGYLISNSMYPTCSLAYYFPIRNNDDRYSTIIRLPQVITMNQVTWQIGCPTTYDDAQCTISGFRHYAWAPLDTDAPDRLVDSSFHFCDQDKRYGDACYEVGDEWVVEVPPHTTYVIRGMVNDLCSGTQGKVNPLESAYVDVSLWVHTYGLWDYEVADTITGTPRSDSLSDLNAAYSISHFISRVEDADPNRYSSQVNWEDSLGMGVDAAGAELILGLPSTAAEPEAAADEAGNETVDEAVDEEEAKTMHFFRF